MDFERNRKKRIEISLIPLIDISIFLLIFFMVTGSIEKFEIISIDPPVAQSSTLVDEGHLVILLGRHGEIIVDDEIIPIKETKTFLTPLLEHHPSKVITVKADATVNAGDVIDVMDAIKAAGGRNLSIATQSKVMPHELE